MDDDHDMYGLHSSGNYADKALMSPENLMLPQDYQNLLSSTGFRDRMMPMFGSDELLSAAPELQRISEDHHHGASGSGCGGGGGGTAAAQEDMLSVIKTKIASHPTYPRLLEAYIDCQKVGAPPEIANLLDEILRGNDLCKRDSVTTYIGADPELDEFMKTYCDMLVKYKSDLARPFDEATTFLNKIEMQLANLCKGSSIISLSDEGAVSSDEEISGGEVEVPEAPPSNGDQDLKARLMNRFGSHISSLKLEFSKKKKKGKLPREARQTLLDWWNAHYKWPYPTEADKYALAESTGLDPKQINNWFINQRKRHWKPSENNMQFGSLENITGQFYMDE